MRALQPIACFFGSHKRSRSAVSFHGCAPTSKCRGCGTAMVKDNGRWRVGTDEGAQSIGG